MRQTKITSFFINKQSFDAKRKAERDREIAREMKREDRADREAGRWGGFGRTYHGITIN